MDQTSWTNIAALSQRDQLATLAVQHGVPASYNLREFAKAGGLMSYGTRACTHKARSHS